MKICLIKPIGHRWEDEQYYVDIGQGFLGTALQKAGHEVRILDCMRERLSWKGFEQFVRENPHDFYALKVYSFGVFSANRAIEIIRRHNPQALIGVGGPHPSGAGAEVLEHIPGADFGWQGEAEIHLPQFLGKMEVQSSKFKVQSEQSGPSGLLAFQPSSDIADVPGLIYRSSDGVKANAPYFHENIDEFGYPDWELLKMGDYLRRFRKIRFIGNYYVPVLTSRGCPMPCAYCGAWLLSGKKIRRHSVEYVVGWIAELKERYGIDFFAFVDDALTADRDYFMRLLEEIVRRDLKIHWDCAQNAVRFDSLDEEMLKLMERSGCFYMCVAVESGSPRVLQMMKRRADIDLVREKVNLIKQTTQIYVMGYFILGYPTETWEDLKATARLSRELPLDSAQFFLYTPHPGSEIYRQLRQEGKLKKVPWQRSHYGEASLPLADVSLQRLTVFHRWTFFRFYARRRFFHYDIEKTQRKTPITLDPVRDGLSFLRAMMRTLSS